MKTNEQVVIEVARKHKGCNDSRFCRGCYCPFLASARMGYSLTPIQRMRK